MRAVAFLVTIAASLSWPCDRLPPQNESFEQLRSDAFEAFVEELEAHAKWCSQKRLFLERANTYELILDYDHDHAPQRAASQPQ